MTRRNFFLGLFALPAAFVGLKSGNKTSLISAKKANELIDALNKLKAYELKSRTYVLDLSQLDARLNLPTP